MSCSATSPSDIQYRYIWETGQITRIPPPVLQLQRQHLRLPGPPDHARSIILRRVVRWEHDGSMTVHRRQLQRPAAELAQRHRAPQGRLDLVHRSLLRRAAGGRPSRPRRRPSSIPSGLANPQYRQWQRRHHRLAEAGAPALRLSLGSQRPAGCGRGRQARPGAQRHRLLARLQQGLFRLGRRHRCGRCGGQQDRQPAPLHRLRWWTA